MSAAKVDREYVSSVTLMILGEDLDPEMVSKALGMAPSNSWRKGDPKRVGTDLHDWGGWKQTLPTQVKELSFESQLLYWTVELSAKSAAISKLCSAGHRCVLDCFITTDETASIHMSPKLQEQLAALGAEIQLSVWVSTNAG